MTGILERLGRSLRDRYFMTTVRRADGHGIVAAVRTERLTYLSTAKFAGICTTLARLKRQGVPGDYLEAGCALGGSSIVIGALRSAGSAFRIYDVFGMIPPPTAEDPPDVIARYQTILAGKSAGIGGDTYYGYVADLEAVVKDNLARHLRDDQRVGIRLVKGLLQDTMEVTAPVAFAHVDVDWYDPVRVSLERIVPNLAPGGTLILDDYFDWGGCRKATDEYLARSPVPLQRDDRFGNLILTRLVA